MSLGKLKSYVNSVFKKKQPDFYMYGSADSFTFDTTPSRLVNYTDSLLLDGADPALLDAAAGSITIPSDGIYEVTQHLVGTQGNTTKEESMLLEIDINATRFTVWSFDVATDKTNYRTFTANYTRQFSAGDVLSQYCTATANMGTFTVEAITFEVVKIK